MGVSFLPPKSCSMRFFSSGERSALCHTNQSTRVRTRHSTCAYAVYIKGINVASEQIWQIKSCGRTDVNSAQTRSLEIHSNRKLSQTWNPNDVSSENTEPAQIYNFATKKRKKKKIQLHFASFLSTLKLPRPALRIIEATRWQV